jgi:hypothetical protein
MAAHVSGRVSRFNSTLINHCSSAISKFASCLPHGSVKDGMKTTLVDTLDPNNKAETWEKEMCDAGERRQI